MLDADRAARLEHLRDRQNRPVVKPITVMVTASGAPGTAALLRALRENGEREVRLVGTDMSERSVGRHLCDAFHIVPGRLRSGVPRRDARGREREGVDAILPQSSFDLEGLAEHVDRFPMPVLVSQPRRDPPLERQGRDVRAAAPARRAGAGVPARQRRARGRGGGARARLPGSARLLQAGVLVRLARLPHPRPDGRPRAPAAERAARARSRCASRRRSSCCPTRAGPTCS